MQKAGISGIMLMFGVELQSLTLCSLWQLVPFCTADAVDGDDSL
jgi:hypothetical protein